MTVSRPEPGEILQLLKRGLKAGEKHRIVHHLISAWKTCRIDLESILKSMSDGPDPGDYRPAFAGLTARLNRHSWRVAQERQQLPELVRHLLATPFADQLEILETQPCFHSWLLGEWLVEESQRFAYVSPDRALALATAAVTLVEALEAEAYGSSLVNDLRARAWARKGDSLRLLSDLRSAEAAFEKAEALVEEGTGDALEEARILELKAALYRDQRRAHAAHQLLDEVLLVYRQYRDSHLLGRAFIQKGRVHGDSDEWDEAISWLRKGLGLLDPGRERAVDLAARHSLMLCLNESGRPREARFLLKASRPEFLQHGSPLLLCRVRWLEGKIYDTLKFPREAEKALLDARRKFIELGTAFSAAAISLDLAAIYAAQGRTAEVRGLSEELVPIFQSHGLQREAIAALIAAGQAARVEKGGTHVLSEIRSLLNRTRQDPRLRAELTCP